MQHPVGKVKRDVISGQCTFVLMFLWNLSVVFLAFETPLLVDGYNLALHVKCALLWFVCFHVVQSKAQSVNESDSKGRLEELPPIPTEPRNASRPTPAPSTTTDDSDSDDDDEEEEERRAPPETPYLRLKTVAEVNELDRKVFQSHSESELGSLELLGKTRGTAYFRKKFGEYEVLQEYLKDLKYCQGTTTDVCVYLIMPVVFGRIVTAFIRFIKPRWTREARTLISLPTVPLVYCQQSIQEMRMKRRNNKSLNALAQHFVLRPNQMRIDLEGIRAAAATRQVMTSSPWSLIELMITLQSIHGSKEEKLRELAKKSYQDNRRHSNINKLANDVHQKILAEYYAREDLDLIVNPSSYTLGMEESKSRPNLPDDDDDYQ